MFYFITLHLLGLNGLYLNYECLAIPQTKPMSIFVTFSVLLLLTKNKREKIEEACKKSKCAKDVQAALVIRWGYVLRIFRGNQNRE
jgi:hypothetical protein